MSGVFQQHNSQNHDDGRSASHRFEMAVKRTRGSIRIRPDQMIGDVLKFGSCMLAGFVLLAVLIGTASAASPRPDTRYDEMPGLYLYGPDGSRGAAPTVVADYDISVDGPVAEVSLQQRFLNPNKDWAEGTYLFPLPDGAAIDSMSVEVNGRRIVGRIEERAEAVRTYETAKSEGRAAAKLEQQRPNMFTMQFANIPPGGDVAISIGYWQVVPYADDAFRLRTPLVVGPRYIPGLRHGRVTQAGFGTAQVPDAQSIISPVRTDGRGNPVRLKVTLNPGFDLGEIVSPHHHVDITEKGGVTTVRLSGDGTPADRDFELVWKPVSSQAPTAGLFTETVGDETYMLMMLTPPDIERQSTKLRDLTFIVDTSGSMHGDSIAQARSALIAGLERLRDEDRFNIVRFSDTTSRLWSESRAATPQNLAEAVYWINQLQADGGTEMLPALAMALSLRPDDSADRLRQVVLMTDGDVGNEADLFSLIRNGLGDARLFTVGIGSAPNGYFMRRAARFGRGTNSFIGDVSEVGEKLTRLFGKLDSAALTDISVKWPGQGAEMWPERVPDLYLGEPLLVTARMKTADIASRVEVSGQLGETAWHGGVDLSAGAPSDGIARLWARTKVEALMDEAGRNAEAARDEVLPLALAHGLQTRFTSFVAVDETPIRPIEASIESHQVPTNLPNGWTRPAPPPDIDRAAASGAAFAPVRLQTGVSLPQTATPAGLYLAIGALLLLIGLAILAVIRRGYGKAGSA
jgi:Ca-activated chloride channel family protein